MKNQLEIQDFEIRTVGIHSSRAFPKVRVAVVHPEHPHKILTPTTEGRTWWHMGECMQGYTEIPKRKAKKFILKKVVESWLEEKHQGIKVIIK